jgi:LuxR family maltose regulon positive regulatory protein
MLDDLLNDPAALDALLVLVLDDYHVIINPEIHTVLEYFLNHQPASTHLVLTTRADPSLPLARLRARRQMTGLRARDLRFSAEEVRAFLGLANLSLAENALRALEELTEGWARRPRVVVSHKLKSARAVSSCRLAMTPISIEA